MKYKVVFVKTLSYTMVMEGDDQQDVSDRAQGEFDNIMNPDEDAVESHWELMDIQEE